MRVFTLIASLAFVLTVPGSVLAADLLYVSMAGAPDQVQIAVFDVSLSTGTAIANSKTTFASSGLVIPEGIAFDHSGNLYLSDGATNSITKYNSNGSIVSIITTDLNSPTGLTIDSSGNIYAVNYRGPFGDARGTISKYDSLGRFVASIGLMDIYGSYSCVVDSSGNIYAGNGFDNNISKFNSSGVLLKKFSSHGSLPTGLALDALGNLYVANYDSGWISMFDSSGQFVKSITGAIYQPYGMTFDSSGNLYVANIGDNSISKFDPMGNLIVNWRTPGRPKFLTFQPVPEPSTYILSTLAFLTLAVMARRRRRTALA